MIIILTIDELLDHTGWSRGPDGDEDLGVEDLLQIDSRIADSRNLAQISIFDAQWVALDEASARRLNIISDLSDFAIRRIKTREERDKPFTCASIIEPHFITKFNIQNEPVTMNGVEE